MPLALAGPLVRRVDAHLRAQARHRARKIEVVDGRSLGDEHIAAGIDARRERPDDLAPVAHVDVVVADDDELRVHELPQIAPDAEHDALGVPGILLAHADHGESIRAAFRRQIEVDDLGKLLDEQRHEQLVQRHAEDRGLVRRLAGIGGVVDRRAAQGQPLDGEHGKALDLVVVAGVVAVRPFCRGVIGPDHALQHDLGARRHLQIAAKALRELRACAAQKAGELVFAERVRHRRNGREQGGRISAEGDRDRKRFFGNFLMVLEIERAAAMREPAHDEAIRPDHLLAVDAEVLALLVRPARHRQAPGDERARITRPASLYRQRAEVDLAAFADELLAGRRRALLRRHVEHPPEHRKLVP